MVSILDGGMSEDQGYTFKRLDPSLYKDLVYISKSAFGFDPGLNYYLKKNETSAFGEPFLGFIAYSKTGEPAAFYGVYAHPVEFNGVVVSAAQSGDTMTHKAHTGKGLFTRLAKMTYELAKENGIKFVFGFPNKNSYPGFVKKLSWICPGLLNEYRIKVWTIPLAKLAKKVSLFRPLYFAYCSLVLSFYKCKKNIFNNSVLEPNISGISRSPEFVKYKSFLGAKMIELNGSCLWIKIDGLIQIGDLDRSASSDFQKVIHKLRFVAFLLGADTIVFQSSPGTYWKKYFSNHFQGTDSLAYGYVDFNSNLPLDSLQFVSADLDTF